MRPKVYISGPITLGDRDHNFRQAAVAQRQLLDAGCAVHNPMLTMALDYAWDLDHDVWIENDLPFIYDALGPHVDAVLRLPGESKGADIECAHAALHGVPIRHSAEGICVLLKPETNYGNRNERGPDMSDAQSENAAMDREAPVRAVRTYRSGATRDSDEGKLDFDGFLSLPVLVRFAEYMHKHRVQADGELRASDNWKKGITLEDYRKSLWRHHIDVCRLLQGDSVVDRVTGEPVDIEDALCAVLFNAQGILHTLLTQSRVPQEDEPRIRLDETADFQKGE